MEAATAKPRRPGSLFTRNRRRRGAPSAEAPGGGSGGHPVDGVVDCACCRRFPLVGELLVRREGPKRSGWVCSTCESDGSGELIGPAAGRDRVRSLGGATNVHRAA